MSLVTRGVGRGALIVPVAVLACVFWWHIGGSSLGPPDVSAQEAAEPPSASRLVLSFNFYGSTPSLSWSPDGQRLAFNAAYEYYGYDHLLATHGAGLGLWVYERDTETARQLLNEQRYHPAWIGNDRIASACSPYEDCVEGLYLTDLSGANTHALAASVYNTHAANDHQVIFYNGFRGYTDWNRFDVATSARETGLSGNCSWEPPPELVQDQCLQQVGDVSVGVNSSRGLWVRYGESVPVQIDETPPFNFSSVAWDCAGVHTGPVPACLSPDGRQVAYVASSAGSLVLRVHELPAAEELAGIIEMLAPAAATPGDSRPVSITELDVSGLTEYSLEEREALAEVPTPPTPSTAPMLMEMRSTPVVDGLPSRRYLAFDYYGDTPSLAWSPDGRHLAFNGAIQYPPGWGSEFGFDAELQGVFVVDPAASTVQRIAAESRFHPTWVGNDAVASICAYHASCSSAVELTDLTGATTRPVSSTAGNLAAAGGSQLFFFDHETWSWSITDVASGRTSREISGNCAWEPPEEGLQDQCIQEVGDVRVWAQVPTGLYVQVGDSPPLRLDPSPPWLFELGGAWDCSRGDFSGPIEPCLSPDGSRVAYVTRSMTGLSVHVHDIPRP